jgi:hypothetical protein
VRIELLDDIAATTGKARSLGAALWKPKQP